MSAVTALGTTILSGWHIRRIRLFIQWWCDRFQREFEATEKVLRTVLDEEAALYTETVAADREESR